MTPPGTRNKISLKKFARLFYSARDREVAETYSGMFSSWLVSMQLPPELSGNLYDLYIPFINLLRNKNYLQQGKTAIIGISGSQGSGKSTFTSLLSNLLETAYGYRVASFSIDDFYHTRASREALSGTFHPLLITRGVPGTHEVKLGFEVFGNLIKAGYDSETYIPVFDKSVDDRMPLQEWKLFKGRPDIILFEGWCVGAGPQSTEELVVPVNILEKEHDPDQRFRKFVNDQLSGDYRKWFSMIDYLVMLKVPSFEQIFEWRWLQEQKLKEKTKIDSAPGKKLRIMTKEEVQFFISHYERITRHMLKEMPARADIVLEVGEDHFIKNVVI